MTQGELRGLYNYTWNVEAALDAATRPFTDAFRMVWRFISDLRRYKRTLTVPLNWRNVIISIDRREFTVFFWDALQAAQGELMRSKSEDLYWGASCFTDHAFRSMDTNTDSSTTTPDTVLCSAWDEEMCKRQKEHFEGTLHPGRRVLGFFLYSDSTFLSSSGAVSAYPLRMRVININTDGVRWVAQAYIRQVDAKFLETKRGQVVRADLLQRILHVVFRTSLLEIHDGTWFNLPGGGCVRVFPRELLYVCDQL